MGKNRKDASEGSKGPKPPTPADLAEKAVREQLGDISAPINFKTGQLSGALPHLWQQIKDSGDGSFPVQGANPLSNPAAKPQDYYLWHQNFGVHHPLVSDKLPCLALVNFAAKQQGALILPWDSNDPTWVPSGPW